jgi:heme-degrading monooxygenase HmoA
MYARLTQIQGKPEQLNEMIDLVNNQVIPGAQNLPGFKGGYWLVDKATGKAATLTFFASEEDLEESAKGANNLRTQATKKLGAKVLSVEHFEVIAQA